MPFTKLTLTLGAFTTLSAVCVTVAYAVYTESVSREKARMRKSNAGNKQNDESDKNTISRITL